MTATPGAASPTTTAPGVRHTTSTRRLADPLAGTLAGHLDPGARQWLTTCSACTWQSVDSARCLAEAAGRGHECAMHPDTRPAPEPTHPDHGIASYRRTTSAATEFVRCYCGKGWDGAPQPVRQSMREHLARTGTAVPDPWPTPEIRQRPRRATGW